MDKRLMHYQFVTDHVPVDDTATFPNYLTHKVAAIVEDTADAAIVAAVIAAAQAEEITDLYLLDKKFIMEAIQEKKERENHKPRTNADRIRAMNDEELAKLMMAIPDIPCDEKMTATCNDCEPCILEWLRRPVKED